MRLIIGPRHNQVSPMLLPTLEHILRWLALLEYENPLKQDVPQPKYVFEKTTANLLPTFFNINQKLQKIGYNSFNIMLYEKTSLKNRF